jgi:hypothetical protein
MLGPAVETAGYCQLFLRNKDGTDSLAIEIFRVKDRWSVKIMAACTRESVSLVNGVIKMIKELLFLFVVRATF